MKRPTIRISDELYEQITEFRSKIKPEYTCDTITMNDAVVKILNKGLGNKFKLSKEK